MNILEEFRNMTNEEKQEMLKILQESEEKPEPEIRQLGEPLGPNRKGPLGQDLTDEQVYDRDHPLTGLWPDKAYDLVQDFYGKRTRVYHSKEEIEEHNRQVREEWIQNKRKYAARYGLQFSDEYNPPDAPIRNR